ncbi:MAG: hypothetical protein GC192_24650 [Bacteroidetes bacterium]|nr:hypothetical protein [Bacteroidota bacterium]
MNQTRLIKILKAFTSTELFQLTQFIQSPLFNDGSRPQKTETLLEQLVKYHPEFKSQDIAKEEIFQVVFPTEDYVMQKLDKVASELMKVVRKFIAVNASHTMSNAQYWLEQVKFFRERGLDGEFRYAAEQVEKLQQKSMLEEEYFFRQLVIETEKMKNMVNLNDKKSDINIPEVIQNLDIYYIISKMEYCSYLMTKSISTHLNSPQSFILLDEVLEAARKNYLDVPVVAAYYYSYSLLLKRNLPEDYEQLKTVLNANNGRFLVGTLKAVHSYMRNYIADKYNQGDPSCLPELFALFKDHAEKGTLLQDSGTILASTLQNAITVALKLGEVEWALHFLEEHRLRLIGADDPEAIYQFNLANCYFYRGDYAVVEHCLANYTYREQFYKLAAKRMEIKLYYETNSPLLDSRLGAFKIFVHELKSILPPDKIAPNNHFADLMRQIIAPKTLGNSARVQKLTDKLETQKAVAEREWLKEKLEKLLEKC